MGKPIDRIVDEPLISRIRQGNLAAKPPRVAIVGGGPGGLFTAWNLEHQADSPFELTLFEGTDRLGGKVLTPVFSTRGIRYEAGAAEFYDYTPVGEDPLRDLVESLGLHPVGLAGAGVHVLEKRIANLDDLSDSLGPDARKKMATFDNWARSTMTPREFYTSGTDGSCHAAQPGPFHQALPGSVGNGLRRYLETMIHSDLATPASKTSTAYGLQNYLMNDPAYMRLYRIAGGNEQLIRALSERISAQVRLSTRVERVVRAENGPMRLEFAGLEGPQSEAFDAVVLALPLEALKRLKFQGGELSEAMGRHIGHHDHPAHYLRVTLLTDLSPQPILGDDGYLMLDAFGGCCLYSETAIEPDARHGVLGWLIGGEAAERMSLLNDQALVSAVLNTLPPSLAHLGGRVVESRVHRWVGAVSAIPGGWDSLPEDRRHRPAATTHSSLLIVGDYLYDSTLNGALESAEYAAGWLAAHLESLRAGNG